MKLEPHEVASRTPKEAPEHPIRVVAITGGRDKPSSRYRVRQHLGRLREHGVIVREEVPIVDKHWELFSPRWQQRHPMIRRPVKVLQNVFKAVTRTPAVARSWASQATWIQRSMLPGLPSWEWAVRRPFVYDVDDATWNAPPLGGETSRHIARRAEVVMVGNSFLADWFQPYAQRIEIVPTAVDTDVWCPQPRAPSDDFIIGWIGTRPSLRYITSIEPALTRVMAEIPSARLVVVCDRPLQIRTLPADRVEFVPWSRETELKTVQSFDVGIMPMIDEPWVYGKCSFKMLQYMACELPVVVTPIGMNADVLAHDDIGFGPSKSGEWEDALINLHRDRAAGRAMGERARRVVVERYASSIVAREIARIFRDIVS